MVGPVWYWCCGWLSTLVFWWFPPGVVVAAAWSSSRTEERLVSARPNVRVVAATAVPYDNDKDDVDNHGRDDDDIHDWRDDPAIRSLSAHVRSKSRLQPRHQGLFREDGDNGDLSKNMVLHQLGRLCCQTGVVSCKEFLETYAVAHTLDEYMHTLFPNVRRVADLAAGHGLLGWFLLALDQQRRQQEQQQRSMQQLERPSNCPGDFDADDDYALSVICVDKCMPPAAQRIAQVMQTPFPSRNSSSEPCWTYVEGDLNQCSLSLSHNQNNNNAPVVSPSCVLVSVHACGGLTDDVLRLALEAQVPCAVVPCCHSLQPGRFRVLQFPITTTPTTTTGTPRLSYDDIVQRVQSRKARIASSTPTPTSRNGTTASSSITHHSNDTDTGNPQRHVEDADKHAVIANVLDEIRQDALQQAGFQVHQILLPANYTGRNRLLLAIPPVRVRTTTDDVVVVGIPNVTKQNEENSITGNIIINNNNNDYDARSGVVNTLLQPFFQRQRPITTDATEPSVQQQQPTTLSSLRIPLADDPQSIVYCHSISGKEKGKQRLVRQIPKHFSFTMAISIWMMDDPRSQQSSSLPSRNEPFLPDNPDNITNSCRPSVNVTTLQSLVNELCASAIITNATAAFYRSSRRRNSNKKTTPNDAPPTYRLQCRVAVSASAEPHYSPTERRHSQLYKFQYTCADGNPMSGLARIHAKTLHHALREQIRLRYGSQVVR